MTGSTSLPSLHDLLDGMRVVTLPLHLRFRGVDHREAVILRGPAGWGEFGPFLEYGTRESSRWLAAAVEAAWEGWPAPVRKHVPVNATLPAVPPDRVAGVLARYDGCTTVKVKVAEPGQSLADDVDRVAATRDIVGPDVRIRVDANAAWDVEEALRRITALAPYDLEYAEQPCPAVEDLAELRRRLAHNGINVLVAADESIRKAEDPIRVAREGAADVVVVKVPPLGGVRRALEISA
jgi:O-succinylbenzoate synthase